jgi:hypothetical protein
MGSTDLTCNDVRGKVLIVRISRSTGAVTGFMLLVLGIWGGLIPFVGPYFGYAFGSHATWHYTANRLGLDILPALAVVVGALILLWAGHRVSGTLGSWLAMAGGGWFAVGPAVSRLWDHGAVPIGGPLFGHTRQMLELVGTFYGLGVVIVGLAAFAHGRFVSRPALVMAEPGTGEPVAEPVASGAVAGEPVARDANFGEQDTESAAPARQPYEAEQPTEVQQPAEVQHPAEPVTTGSGSRSR